MKNLPKNKRKNNKSGVTGVALTDSFCHCYIVNDSGKRFSKKFSVAKYGKYEALRLAIKWRRDNELKIHGYSVVKEELIHQNSKHRQSSREAESMKLFKKQAAAEYRENKLRELATQKKNFQKMAGKFIYRIDDLDSGHGWLLRIEIQKKLLFDGLFRDKKYGSAHDALQRAQEERETQLRIHNIPYANGRRFSQTLRSTNRTGVTGVCRSAYYYYCYIPVQPNKTKTRKISIDKYGEELAFRMAVEWRKDMEAQVYGDTVQKTVK
jgi:AP2 domain